MCIKISLKSFSEDSRAYAAAPARIIFGQCGYSSEYPKRSLLFLSLSSPAITSFHSFILFLLPSLLSFLRSLSKCEWQLAEWFLSPLFSERSQRGHTRLPLVDDDLLKYTSWHSVRKERKKKLNLRYICYVFLCIAIIHWYSWCDKCLSIHTIGTGQLSCLR